MIIFLVISYIERINWVYWLIWMERIGSLDELVFLLWVSRWIINNYLEEFCLMGVEIRFSRRCNMYYFGNNFVLYVMVEVCIDVDVLDKFYEKEDDIYNYNKY